MAQQTNQVVTLIKADKALETLTKMNLDVELLLDAVKIGHAARANAGENHPPTTAGFYAYSETNFGLSKHLLNLSWSRRVVDNIPILIHPSGAYQIVVSSGDIATGTELKSTPPSTLRQKGVKFSSLFGGNCRDLFDKEIPTGEQLMQKTKGICPTYILLYYYDSTKKETHCELSLPTPADQAKIANKEKQCISEWDSRIVIGSVGGEPDLPPKTPDFTDEPDLEITQKKNRIATL